jgi:hypothetical protein
LTGRLLMDSPIDTTRTRTELRRTGLVALAVLAWVLTLALANFGPRLIWNGNPALTWVALALNLIAGVLVIASYARLLRSQDDLQRKISLDALAVTFGLSLVLGFAYIVARAAGLLPFELELVWFLTGSAVLYTIATLVSWLRYRA